MNQHALTILHLSDLHLGGPERTAGGEHWRALEEDLFHVLRQTPDPRFVVVSGDLTWSGQAEQFEEARSFISAIVTQTGVPTDRMLMVPGNHDCDRSMKREGLAQLHNFVAFSRGFGRTNAPPINNVVVFEAERVVFVLLSGLDLCRDRTGLSDDFSRIHRELESYATQNYLRIAVVHHGPDAQLRERSSDDELDDAFQHSLNDWGIHLLLHSRAHGSSPWTMVESASGTQLRVASGPAWRAPWQSFLGAPAYNLITVSDTVVRLHRRIFDPHAKAWVNDPSSQLLRPIERTRLLSSRSAAQNAVQSSDAPAQLRSLCEQITELPQQDVATLVAELQPEIPPYDPVEECRSDFARRLVRYFADAQAIFVLQGAVERLRRADAKTRVFVSHSGHDQATVAALTDALEQLRFEVFSVDQWPAKPGPSIVNRRDEAMRQSDVCVLLLTSDAPSSPSLLGDLGMWIGMHGLSRVVVVKVEDAAVPTDLLEARLVRIDDRQDMRSGGFLRELRSRILLSLADTPSPSAGAAPPKFSQRDIARDSLSAADWVPGEGDASRDLVRRQVMALAHELRAPLAMISNLAARAVSVGDDPVKLHRIHSQIAAFATRARILTTNSQVAAHSMSRREPTNIEAAVSVADALNLLVGLTEDVNLVCGHDREIQWLIDRGSFAAIAAHRIRIDRDMLEAVLFNVLDNAAKYSYASTPVRIAAHQRDANKVEVVIENRGLGIAPEEMSRCGTLGWRGERASAVTGTGAGLGLWATRRMLQSYGGYFDITCVAEGNDIFRTRVTIGLRV